MDKHVVEFLLCAKKATYAGNGVEAKPSRPNSHDLEYTEGSLKYIDTYLGSAKFAGEEALWKDDVPFYSMNYVGRVIADGFSGDFLKEALALAPEDAPFRGPQHYENGDFAYGCTLKGDADWFDGFEEISLKGKKVYECVFHGGSIEQ